MQHRLTVVRKQAARRIEAHLRLGRTPKCLIFLGRTESVGRIGRIQKIEHARLFVFDLQDRRMRVRQQHQTLAAQPQFLEETSRTGQPGNSTSLLAMYGRNIDIELFAPIVDGIPLQRALHPMKARRERSMRLRERKTFALGIDFRHTREPDVVVESKVKQGTVEIKQDGVDGRPIRSVGSRDIHVGMIPAR